MNVAWKVDPARVAELADEGYSESSVAVMLGCSRERIRQIKVRDGLTFVTGKVDHDGHAAALALHCEGLIVSEIAAQLEHSERMVRRAIREAGLEPNRDGLTHEIVAALAATGMTLTEAAAAAEVTRGALGEFARRVCIRFRGQHGVRPDTHLTGEALERYRELRRKQMPRDAALAAVGRFDLIEMGRT